MFPRINPPKSQIVVEEPVVRDEECLTMEAERLLRVAAFRKYLRSEAIDVAIVQNKQDMYWLSGFNTPGTPPSSSDLEAEMEKEPIPNEEGRMKPAELTLFSPHHG